MINVQGQAFLPGKEKKEIIFQDFLRPPLIVELYIYNASKEKRLSKNKSFAFIFSCCFAVVPFWSEAICSECGLPTSSLGEATQLSGRAPTSSPRLSSSSSWSFNTKQWLLFWQRPDTDQTQLRWLLTRYDKICESRYMEIYSKKWSEHDSLYGNDQHHHHHRHYDHNHHHHSCNNAISQNNNIWLNNQFFLIIIIMFT